MFAGSRNLGKKRPHMRWTDDGTSLSLFALRSHRAGIVAFVWDSERGRGGREGERGRERDRLRRGRDGAEQNKTDI